ncbi:hypothetical protein ACLOJK_001376 [Asimina triloba]
MEKEKLHIVLLPWFAFGHMIPYLDLAKRFARMGHRVSYLSTPRNIDRLPTVPPDLQPQLNFVKLTTSPVSGLPEDAQSTRDAPSHQICLIMKLQDGMEGPLRAFIQDNPFPDWIIYDMFHHWAPAVAADYGISSAFFTILPAMSHCFIGPPSALLDSREDPSPHHFTAPPPWIPFPTNLAWRYHDAVRLTKNASGISSVTGVPMNQRLGKAIQGCDVAAVRSCIDFEPEWIQLLSQLYQKPVFPLGFLPPSATGWNNEVDEPLAVLEWLGKQKPGSTVYVAFGSEWQLNREEVHEIAFGLERSGLPFFWAYRADEDLLPEGFEDRMKSQGLIHVGWAPQGRLLSHKSIGCFLTHAGWGSTVEGLALGKPLVMLPMHADQGLIALRMAEKKVGVDVPRKEEDGSFEGDGVAKCLKLVMLEKEGELIRSNALQMMKIFGNEKRNNQYIEEFVNYLIENRRQNSCLIHNSRQMRPT